MADRPYNPTDAADRKALAEAMVAMLEKAKFKLVSGSSTEDIYEFDCASKAPGCKVKVFTSIFRGEAREVGADAVRVVGTYTRSDARNQGLADETRVNRTGTIEGVTARCLERMRSVYSSVVTSSRCAKCGAPMFKSRKGNLVCAETCWAPKNTTETTPR